MPPIPPYDAPDHPEPAPDPEPSGTMVQLTIASSGNVVAFGYPEGLTDAELVEFIGWLTTTLRPQLRRRPGLIRVGSLEGLRS